MITPKVFLWGMTTLSGAFGGRELSEHTLDIYRRYLGDLTDEEFVTAINESIGCCTYFPAVGELRARARGNLADRAADALGRVREIIAEFGGPQFTPNHAWSRFDTPMRSGIAAAGGLAAIWNAREDDRAVSRAFADAYARAAISREANNVVAVNREPRRITEANNVVAAHREPRRITAGES